MGFNPTYVQPKSKGANKVPLVPVALAFGAETREAPSQALERKSSQDGETEAEVGSWKRSQTPTFRVLSLGQPGERAGSLPEPKMVCRFSPGLVGWAKLAKWEAPDMRVAWAKKGKGEIEGGKGARGPRGACEDESVSSSRDDKA